MHFTQKKLRISILLFLSLISSACVEHFTPKTFEYNDMLFIEGYLNNDSDDSPYVLISKSMPLAIADSIQVLRPKRNERFYFQKDPVNGTYRTFYYGNEILYPQSNAEVSVLCDDGNTWLFIEVVEGSGVYLESSGTFRGEAGKSYKIQVNANNNVFESNFEKLKVSVPIDSVSFKAETQKTDEFGTLAEGYQVYVNTNCPTNENYYFRWKTEETFRYISQVRSTHKSRGGKNLQEFDNKEISVCYTTNILHGKYIESTEKYNSGELNNIPLNFVSQYGNKLTNKYYINVRQYSISKSVYNFWKDINLTHAGTGGLYAVQPFPVQGNIFCTNDKNVKVIGVFEVAGVSNAISSVSYPHEFEVFYGGCALDTIFPERWPYILDGTYIVEREKKEGGLVHLTTADDCFDCRLKGGTTEMPDIFKN